MNTKQIEVVCYLLIVGWFIIVILFNIFKYALEKQRMELYTHHLQYQYVNIIERNLKPIYLKREFLFAPEYIPKEHVKKEIDYNIQLLANHDDFKKCCEVKFE